MLSAPLNPNAKVFKAPCAKPAILNPPAKKVHTFVFTPTIQDLNKLPIHPKLKSNYEFIEVLGTGGSAFVVSALDLNTQDMVAIKFIYKDRICEEYRSTDKDLGEIPREVSILRQIQHPNIVNYIDFFQDVTFFYLVMELFGDDWTAANPSAPKKCRDLFQCLDEVGSLDERQARKLFFQIISTLKYLQSKKIYHGDLKDENILIDHKLNVKLVDFGNSRVATPENHDGVFLDFRGTWALAPPEVICGSYYSIELTDVWALGVMLHICLFGESPFMSIEDEFKFNYRPPKECSKLAGQLLSGMLQRHPLKRFNFDDIITHPFFH